MAMKSVFWLQNFGQNFLPKKNCKTKNFLPKILWPKFLTQKKRNFMIKISYPKKEISWPKFLTQKTISWPKFLFGAFFFFKGNKKSFNASFFFSVPICFFSLFFSFFFILLFFLFYFVCLSLLLSFFLSLFYIYIGVAMVYVLFSPALNFPPNTLIIIKTCGDIIIIIYFVYLLFCFFRLSLLYLYWRGNDLCFILTRLKLRT